MDPRGKKRVAGVVGGDESQRPQLEQRKVRFPKGKKAKYRDPTSAAARPALAAGGDVDGLLNPEIATLERAKRRHKKIEDDLKLHDVTTGEIHYEDDANFDDGGIPIDPFNLNQEREEGYFDESGNFVEYARHDEIKDAWLDNVQVDTKYAGKAQEKTETEEDFQDLSSDDIGKLKRNIANVLEPGETIIQALKRLKGSSTDKRAKMSEEKKRVFDMLTDAAMKLMENGEYNVYMDDRETFVREAEGYERLARARQGISERTSDVLKDDDIFSDNHDRYKYNSSLWEMDRGLSASNVSSTVVSANNDNSEFDMFGDNDETTDVNHVSDGNSIALGYASQQLAEGASGRSNAEGSTDAVGEDYVYDPASSYYYSSSLGYYYDPATGYYCSATTGTWYSFDEQTGAYKDLESDGVKD